MEPGWNRRSTLITYQYTVFVNLSLEMLHKLFSGSVDLINIFACEHTQGFCLLSGLLLPKEMSLLSSERGGNANRTRITE